MDIYYQAKLILFSIIFLIFFLHKKMLTGNVIISFLLFALCLVPNSSVFSDQRILGSGFKLFNRYIFGLFSIWDIFLIFSLLLIYIKKTRSNFHLDFNLKVVGIVWGFGLAVGIYNSIIFPYGPTSLRNLVTQSLPIFYFIASAYLSTKLLKNSINFVVIYKVLQLCSVIIIIEGLIFLILTTTINLPILRGFGNIPIVVYDGLAFLNITLLITFDKYTRKLKISTLEVFLFIGSVLFILLSTRRMNIAFLFLNFIFLYFVNSKSIFSGRMILRMSRDILLIVLPVFAVMYAFSPSLFETFIFVLKTFNMASEAGEVSAGFFRIAQIENMFLNMKNYGINSYIHGMGLGTMWYEFTPLPNLSSEGDAGYIASLHELGSSGWWPYFHLSNLSTIYRFGFLGAIIILVFMFRWLYTTIQSMRIDTSVLRSIAMISALLSFQTVITLGDSTDAAWPALCGLLAGISISLNRIYRLSIAENRYSAAERISTLNTVS